MSEKTLGQVAFEAKFNGRRDIAPWEDQSFMTRAEWERTAQAVVDYVGVAVHQAVAMREYFKAEERELCIEKIRKACNGSNVMVPTWEVMKLLREGGTPPPADPRDIESHVSEERYEADIKAEGAAEERERLADMLDTSYEVWANEMAVWLRNGGKP